MTRPKLYEWDPTLEMTVQSVRLEFSDDVGSVGGARNAAMRAARDMGRKCVTAVADLVDETTMPARQVGVRLDAVFFKDPTQRERAKTLVRRDREPDAIPQAHGRRGRPRRARYEPEVICPECRTSSPDVESKRCYNCDPVGHIYCGVCGSLMHDLDSPTLVKLAGSRLLMGEAAANGFDLSKPSDLRWLAQLLERRANTIEAGGRPDGDLFPRVENGPPLTSAGQEEAQVRMTPETGMPVADPSAPAGQREGLDEPYDWTSHLE